VGNATDFRRGRSVGIQDKAWTPPCRPGRQIHNNKHCFDIPRGILVNTDNKQIAASDEVTSVLRPPLQTFSLPARLGIVTKE
jgi:hypothetical protein